MSEQSAEQAGVEDLDTVLDNDTSALDAEPALILDEDRMGTDPLEDGMDTAEGYSRDVRLGGTAAAEETDTLDERIPQEEPDVTDGVDADPPGRPIAATPAMDLDESVDDARNSVDGVGDYGTATTPPADPLDPDGAVEAETLTDAEGEVQVGLSSAAGEAEPGGLPTDSRIGEVSGLDNETSTAGAEQEALHVEQES